MWPTFWKGKNLSAWVEGCFFFNLNFALLLAFWYFGDLGTKLFYLHLKSSVCAFWGFMTLGSCKACCPCWLVWEHISSIWVFCDIWTYKRLSSVSCSQLREENISLPWDDLVRGHVSARRPVDVLVGERMPLNLGASCHWCWAYIARMRISLLFGVLCLLGPKKSHVVPSELA